MWLFMIILNKIESSNDNVVCYKYFLYFFVECYENSFFLSHDIQDFSFVCLSVFALYPTHDIFVASIKDHLEAFRGDESDVEGERTKKSPTCHWEGQT